MVVLNIPRAIAQNIVRLFTNRNAFIYTNEKMIGPRKTSFGLPQGSVLSPILFNLYTADIHSNLNIPNTNILQYADDFCLYVNKKTLRECINELDLIGSFCKQHLFQNGFEISPSKSAVTIFTRHRIQRQDFLHIGNLHIPWKYSFKYLGVVLDQKLTWEEHITNLIAKGEKSLNILKVTIRRTWGADPNVAMLFYRAYTRSIIDSGSIFYGSATNTRLQKVDRLQYKALRITMGAFKSTPIEALLAASGETPLSLRRSLLAQKFIVKNIFINNQLLLNKIKNIAVANLTLLYWTNKNSPPLTDAFTEVSCHSDSIVKLNNLPIFNDDFENLLLNIDILFPDYTEIQSYNNNIVKNIIYEQPNVCPIFTDGSKSQEGVGFAFYNLKTKQNGSFKCNDNCSIFTAECMAIVKALDYIIQEKRHHTYIIFTDSFSALQALKNKFKHLYRNPIILDITKKVYELKLCNIIIRFVWVKGHAGIKGNEAVDILAKQATQNGAIVTGLQYYDVQPIIKSTLLKKWKNKYIATINTKSSHYSKINLRPSYTPIFKNISLNRHQYVTIIRIIFGHGNFGYHLHKIKLVDDPTCHCDNVSLDDLDHWLFGCQFNKAATNFLYKELQNLGCQPFNCIVLINEFLNNSEVKSIFIKFIDKCNRKL